MSTVLDGTMYCSQQQKRISLLNLGELFAKCPVDAHPGIAVESVTDSSRYFVLRIKDDGGRCRLHMQYPIYSLGRLRRYFPFRMSEVFWNFYRSGSAAIMPIILQLPICTSSF